jgi:hypothetical protein
LPIHAENECQIFKNVGIKFSPETEGRNKMPCAFQLLLVTRIQEMREKNPGGWAELMSLLTEAIQNSDPNLRKSTKNELSLDKDKILFLRKKIGFLWDNESFQLQPRHFTTSVQFILINSSMMMFSLYMSKYLIRTIW